MRALLMTIAIASTLAAPAAAQPTVKDHIDAMRHLRLGQENLRAEKWDLAEREFRAAVELELPTWISLALGSAYFRAGAMADAEREYRAAIGVDPKLGEAHNNLAVVFMLTGRFADAEQEIKAAEKSGFRVNPQLKEDLKKAAARR